MGGLGNQMFQYALGRHLSIINQIEYKLDISCYQGNVADPMRGIRLFGLDNFNIKAEIASKDDLVDYYTKTNNKLFRKMIYFYRSYKPSGKQGYLPEPEANYFRFNPDVIKQKITAKKFYIKGYWQTEKYFTDIADIIKSDFEFKNPPDEKNAKLLKDIENSDSVGVHVRHGDNANNVVPWHGALSLEYYNQAVKILTADIKDPVFYIFSDDPEWSKNNLRLEYPTVYISHNGDEKNHEDLRLMAACKNHIIGNSTFSWWGAWLAKKPGQKVIAPKNYYINYNVSKTDFYPKDWLTL